MLVLSREVVLPADSLPLAAELAGVSLPSSLSPDVLWRDPEEDRAYRDAAVDAMASQGVWGRGGPDEAFVRTMTVLCRGTTELSATVESGRDRHYRLLVAASGKDAVLACHMPSTSTVVIRPARPDAIADSLVRELPRVPPADGPAVSVPESAVQLAIDGGPARHDARLVLDIAALPRHGGGQITAATRDGLGGRRTSGPDVCTYYDTDHGRYLFSFSTTDGGERYVNVAPARYETMVTRMHALLDHLTGQSPAPLL
ncbi:ESX secretion-associated protein EspG [Amycolatopsis benzoatilytica]|uniref:ESX secretion-associated protein EspG n=1 Tax=Amycolatopsis benzoatilytica TaxID=346045 RepID=UPI000364B2C3|nr:ESX secretion-associated protein EspG [Amycolatopsis benzoatilytica]